MAALQKIPAPDVLYLFIEHLRGERRLAEKTCEAYQRDVSQFLGFLTGYLETTITLPKIVEVETRGFRAYLAAAAARGEASFGSLYPASPLCRADFLPLY